MQADFLYLERKITGGGMICRKSSPKSSHARKKPPTHSCTKKFSDTQLNFTVVSFYGDSSFE